MTNRLSTGVFIGHCPLRNVNYDVVSVCEMKTIFRNRSDPTAYSSALGHTGKIRRPKIKGLSVIPSTRTFSRINPKSATFQGCAQSAAQKEKAITHNSRWND